MTATVPAIARPGRRVVLGVLDVTPDPFSDGGRHDSDVVAEVRQELCARVDAALAAGVCPDRLLLDPGLGFAERPEHDLALLAGLEGITGLGFPVLVGASRKRFLGTVLAGVDGRARTPRERDAATLATTVLAARAGAWGVRVHDVAGSVDAVRVVAAVAAGAAPRGPRTGEPAARPVPGDPGARGADPGCQPASRRTTEQSGTTEHTERWRSA